jgi:hypothetical protein
MSDDDIQKLNDYFEMISLKRFLMTFAKRASANQTDLDKYLVDTKTALSMGGSKRDLGVVAKLNIANKVIDTVDKAWTVVKKIIGSSTSVKLLSTNTELGFSRFSQSTVMNMYKGVPFRLIPTLKERIISTVKMPRNKQDQFKKSLDFLATEAEASNINSFIIGDSDGTSKFFALLWYRDFETGKYTLFLANVDATFKIAPDLYMWEKTVSKWGGAKTSTNVYFDTRPHKITVDEQKKLLNFFENIAMEKWLKFLEQVKVLLDMI